MHYIVITFFFWFILLFGEFLGVYIVHFNHPPPHPWDLFPGVQRCVKDTRNLEFITQKSNFKAFYPVFLCNFPLSFPCIFFIPPPIECCIIYIPVIFLFRNKGYYIIMKAKLVEQGLRSKVIDKLSKPTNRQICTPYWVSNGQTSF